MAPIAGVTDAEPRFTRAGHIRLGIKKKNSKGTEYPEKSDHFIADFESEESTRLFYERYGPEPKKIEIAFAHADADGIFPQFYKSYGSGSGLKCKGDGITASRADGQGNMVEVECPGPQVCDYAKANGCKQQAALMFFIRGLPGFQVFQCNTTSWNSIHNINSGLKMLQVVRGDKPIRGVWVDLYLVPMQTQHNGKAVTVYVLKLDIPTDLDNLKALECALEVSPQALPEPDNSRDEYLQPYAEPQLSDIDAEFKAAAEAAGSTAKEEAAKLMRRHGTKSWSAVMDAQKRQYIKDLQEVAVVAAHEGDY